MNRGNASGSGSSKSNSLPKPIGSMSRKDSWGNQVQVLKDNGSTNHQHQNSRRQYDVDDDQMTIEEWPASQPTNKNVFSKSSTIKKEDSFSHSIRSNSVTTSGKNSFQSRLSTATTTTTTTNASSTAYVKPTIKKSSSTTLTSNQPAGQYSIFNRPAPTASLSRSTTPFDSQSQHQPQPGEAGQKRALPWDASELDRSSKQSKSTVTANAIASSSKRSTSLATSTETTILDKLQMSKEQQDVLQGVLKGESVFFTGSAGTGKSVLLRAIIEALRKKHKGQSDAVAVTASTGMAACNIGGNTIHSFAGIGIGDKDAKTLIAKVKKDRQAGGRWKRTKVLVIDEISMVDGALFDKLHAIACELKGKGNFGEIQLIVTGDFFQLPPVSKGGVATFAFDAVSWKKCIKKTVNLTQVFRQKETRFINMLNEMRFGSLSAESIRVFKTLSRVPVMDDGTVPTELFSTRNEVATANKNHIKNLPGEAMEFKAIDWEKNPPYPGRDASKSPLNNLMAPDVLTLKVGAQVMLIKNMDVTLVNGTIGIVIGFGKVENEDEPEEIKNEADKGKAAAAKSSDDLAPRVEWRLPGGAKETKTMVREDFKVDDHAGNPSAKRRQYPLILAWAMSIHKSQGQTLPRVKVDLSRIFEKGQAYVALSRATSLEGLQVIGFNEKKVNAHMKVVNWNAQLQVYAPSQ